MSARHVTEGLTSEWWGIWHQAGISYRIQGRRKQHEAVGAAIYGGHFIILSLVKIVSTKLWK